MSKLDVSLFVVAHLMLGIFLYVILMLPDMRSVPSYEPLLIAVAVIEAVYLICLIWAKARRRLSASSAIMILVWAIFIAWELGTTKSNTLSVMIFPAPEKVFDVYAQQYDVMLYNALYSVQLLVVGFLGGIALGAALGILVGWFSPLRFFFKPIAKVLAPIPPMILSPYFILIMPTFRAASIILVGITTFMFVFLSTIEDVSAIDQEILDTTRMMHVGSFDMITRVIAPYVLPSIMSSLKLYLIMGFMMLIFAETLGSSYGLGHWISVNHVNANYANLIAGIIEIGVMVIIVNKLAEMAQHAVIRWK